MNSQLDCSGYRTSKLKQESKLAVASGQKKRQRRRSLTGLSIVLFALCCSIATPVSAAERLTLRLGPLQRSVAVNDLEEFAKTGKLPASLRLYAPVLTPQVRQILGNSLQIEPSVAEKFLEELLNSPDGERLIEQLSIALPGSKPEQLKAAIQIAVQQADGLSAISFLRAYPAENLTVDATAAVGIVVQLNASNLQSRILAPMLERELSVETTARSIRSSIDPTAPGAEQIRRRTLILRDRQRQRTIPVDIYYSANTSGPLVVMSHGFAADRKFLTYLAEHLASYGLTVAALEHPGSNIDAVAEMSIGLNPADLLPASEFSARPQDVSFLLDQLQRLNKYPGYLENKFNTEQVTIIGHSLGGYTALALAGGELNLPQLRFFCSDLSPLGRSPADWLQCAGISLPDSPNSLRDRRIVSAIALNPLVGKLFGDKGLNQIKIPTMILAGSEDAIAPPLHHQLLPFTQLKGEKYLLTAIGGTHMSVTDIGNINSAVRQTTLVKELLGTPAEPLRQLVKGTTLAFIKQQSPEANNYKLFLTPEYAQSLTPTVSGQNPSPLQLRLTTQLPARLEAWLQVLGVSDRPIAYKSPLEETQRDPLATAKFLPFAPNFLRRRKTLPKVETSSQNLDSYLTELLED
ncbi:alpha/beta hydrolase [Oscillatoria salina]|uniref:alpha/beta hydrolase n=1 Tax=Oscillatoria salina TaxID=331517 RepID=UPI001CCE25FD|nr:alpha/beta hydrolase [Oscillatoria salina]MBZ8179621.1 alpha/beta hydrolase [Oscillatoria salina IIICB1]